MNCPKCGSSNTNPHGIYVHCNECGRYTTINKTPRVSTLTEKRETNTAVFDGTVPRIMSDEHLLDFLNIDRETWRITKVVYGKSEGYRKDRQVTWKIQDGKTEYGEVNDTGKLLIEPLFSVRVYLARKVEEIAARNEVEELRKAAKQYAPKYKKIKYQKRKGFLYEIAMPDLQLGRLVQADEAGLASSPDLYIKKAETALNKLIAVPYPLERILFPIGNDFFNSNTSEMKTAHGTPQQDDVRWQRTYKLAKEMIINAIENMTQVAPVDIVIVKGNHDEERIFYFGDTLESWFLENGVVIRILRSLAPPSVWEYDKGFVGSLKAAEGFLWHKDDGLFAQFTATADA